MNEFYVYCGPYLTIKNKYTEVTIKFPKTCPDHPGYGGNFCSICGKKIPSEELASVMAVDLEEEGIIDQEMYPVSLNDIVFNDQSSIWIPNTSTIGKEFFDGESILSLTTEWQESQMSLFKEHCSEVFKRLAEQNFQYEICFGIISYWR